MSPFSWQLIGWYEENKRDLPWRDTTDPYRIWVSEVILQQTRVVQGMAYYNRFVECFPDVGSLALAEEEDVLKIWQGLGYYSRARHMHQAAKAVLHEHKAVFPRTYDELRRLKGVGDYSASAISSLAGGEPQPAVDGNVLRVLARYEGIRDPVNTVRTRRMIKTLLKNYIDPQKPGIFNQAVMDLGALVCKPGKPLCQKCPLSPDCYAFRNGLTSELPVTSREKPVTARHFNYLVILTCREEKNYIWLKKRTGNDIWKNLYDFPLVETPAEIAAADLAQTAFWLGLAGTFTCKAAPVTEKVTYKLSHRELRVAFQLFHSDDFYHPDFLKICFNDLHNYPVPRLIEKYLKKFVI